ncbi:MAG: Holliday junction branch migration protein RuvA [Clostridia bacterium]|nr:Holliday junction branch migration protein RuvA [Clostridia bacterium]
MFDFIRGFVRKLEAEYCVVEVGGVGFRIYTSLSSIGSVDVGEEVVFYTHLVVKEDDMTLFGFATDDELSAFELLISVSGVGPKVAVGILSQMSPADFCTAVISENHKAISQAKGVGPKLAQRIVLELKDKIKKTFDDQASAAQSVGATETAVVNAGGVFDEAVEALMVLGYNTQKARQAVGRVYSDGMTLEDLVKAALKAG